MAIRSLKTGLFTRSGMAGNPVIMPGSYESIATANGTGSSGIITFSSIPSTYTHLQIRGIANAGGVGADLNIRLNGDNSSIYTRHRLIGDGSTASALGQTGRPWITFLGNATLPTASNTYGVFVCDILDYTNTNKNTTVRVLSGQDSNGSGGVDFTSGLWPNTAAVTSVSIQLNTGNLTTASQFALYGVN
jgi:hypothetical protein